MRLLIRIVANHVVTVRAKVARYAKIVSAVPPRSLVCVNVMWLAAASAFFHSANFPISIPITKDIKAGRNALLIAR
jgi:D-serine deaminase-like pyridoxal phosphate-dependent protein